MIKNYLKTTLRILYSNKGFTAINILGLSIGFACCIFIALYISHEVSVDRFHPHADRTYRVTTSFIRHNQLVEQMGITSPKIGEDLHERIPEIEGFLRLGHGGGSFKFGDKEMELGDLFVADSTLWDILGFKLIAGDKNSCLSEPFSIVLSESIANSMFGDKNPMGQVIVEDGNTPYTITGIVENHPTNTRIKYKGFISFSTLKKTTKAAMEDWDGNISFFTLVKMSENVDLKKTVEKANTVADELINQRFKDIDARLEVGFQPIGDIHLYNKQSYDEPGVARILYGVGAIALFILVIAGFNFVNLTTARSARRSKEVGLRMTVGASKLQVRLQFIGESLLLALVASMLSLLLVEMLIPSYNNLLSLNLSLYNPQGAVVAFAVPFFVLLFGIAAGLYPALFLSSFNPIRILKADFAGGRSKPVVRNILVTLQFTIASLLIVVTTTVYLQINFLKSKDLGLDTEGLVVASAKGNGMWQKVESIKETLRSIPEIESVSVSSSSLGYGISSNGYRVEGMPDHVMMSALAIDYDYLETIGARIIEGRNLSPQFPSDERGVIVNQTLVRLAGWDNAIGKKITREKEFVVVGVVEDFHYKSMHSGIEPIIMLLPFDYFFWGSPIINVRIKKGQTESALEKIRAQWESMGMSTDFNYSFVQDVFRSQYKTEESFGRLFILFTVLAVFISCMGLLGLSNFMLENRRREISIRKVLGSNVRFLVARYSVDFTRWALLGTLISWPIAYYVLTQLLGIWAYRLPMPWLVFILTALATFVIALATVIVQTYKSAQANPAHALKYE